MTSLSASYPFGASAQESAIRPGNLFDVSTATPFAELFVAESEHAATARENAVQIGCRPVSVGAGATLAFIAACAGAGSAVEIGTGTGVSGLRLLEGMTATGILTSIDVEPECHRLAKQTFNAAGIAPNRARLINGRALEVLPRLTDGGYDLVLVDGAPEEYPQYVAEALRLLRPGGTVILAHALAGGSVTDPTQRDAPTVAVREAGRAIRDDEDLTAVLLPLGDGLIAATKR